MIGTSRFEYFYINFFIYLLHYYAPLCLIFCISSFAINGLQIDASPLLLLAQAVTLLESVFFLCFFPYRYYLQRKAVHSPVLNRAQRKELFTLCNENIPNTDDYLRKWFLDADPNEIKRENLKDFLLWAFFKRDGPPGDDDEELEEYVAAFEKVQGRPIAAGRGKAVALRITLDKVKMLHRSLLWFFCVGFVDTLAFVAMAYNGFYFHRTSLSRFFTLFPFRPLALTATHRSPAKYTTYWYRPHTSTNRIPVLFIHGIGIGLYPYTKFLRELNSASGIESFDPNDQVGIIAIELMPLSFRLTHSMLSRKEICSEIGQILDHHLSGNQKVVVAAHSFGTNITSLLLKTPSTAKRIQSVVLIDPIPVLLHLPTVAYNFTRRVPREANEHQLHYFASMDIGVAHTLGRHFFWDEVVLWKSTLGRRNVTISIAGRDLMVDTTAVGRYFGTGYDEDFNDSGVDGGDTSFDESTIKFRSGGHTDMVSAVARQRKGKGILDEGAYKDRDSWKNRKWRGKGIDIFWFPNLDHGQVFDKSATRIKILSAIRQYCETAE